MSLRGLMSLMSHSEEQRRLLSPCSARAQSVQQVEALIGLWRLPLHGGLFVSEPVVTTGFGLDLTARSVLSAGSVMHSDVGFDPGSVAALGVVSGSRDSLSSLHISAQPN